MRNLFDIGFWFAPDDANPPDGKPQVSDVAVAEAPSAQSPTTSAAAPSVARPVNDQHERLVALTEGLARVEDALRTRQADTDRADRVIDRLEAEVKRLRQREDERRLESAVQRIIGLFDQVSTVATGVRGRQDEMAGTERELAKTIVALEQQMLELLDRLGARALVPNAASPFDAVTQEVISTLETPEAEKHLTVASVRRPGFEFAGRVLRPVAVQVFRRSAGASSPAAKERVS